MGNVSLEVVVGYREIYTQFLFCIILYKSLVERNIMLIFEETNKHKHNENIRTLCRI